MIDLKIFQKPNLFEAATSLFQQLSIKLNSNTSEALPVKDLLKHYYKDNDTFNSVDKAFFIGIIDDTVFKATGMFDVNYSYKEALAQGDKHYEGLMLFALDLKNQPTRTEISELTRAFNRISQKMPVALLLKYNIDKEVAISFAISERFKYKQNWRQGEKAGKVIILRDIHSETTHAGHERILLDLVKPAGVTTFAQLHEQWLQVLDVSILNKRFFQELANWYFWAMDNVSFPDDLEKKKDVRNATNLIRLITRVVFIWFIKEKSLVPNALFKKSHLDKILKDFNKNEKSQNYYHAILQNLFFGTLNQKMDERKFAKDGGNIKTNGEEYGVKNLFRYADLFTISEKEAMQLFKDVPFLNGGLFDCLDKPNEEGKIVYVDGFSRNPKKQAIVPDYIFFGEEREVDLNDIFATKNKKYKSRGLINLLESYKFTVTENTPIEEEIALDPELLGKVFENLLASYNPETQTTARKQTGSFYTPREIVNYMVDESLLEYINQNVRHNDSDFEILLRELISYAETPNPFDEAETKALIEAINKCKILDPACGSGAYPMGILHKMVHLLQKLDPENKYWKAVQRQKAMEETEAAFKIGDKEERGKRLAEINDVFENNASDYGRKLYLIENCIYGIDIQPIAVQISKLRFFISLIIDQNKQTSKENFGIRSLPNLETKFVAANTLIGLDKPSQTLLRNPEIEVKENQLKELRHKYFTANTRKEKLQYQKQDKKLRQEIAKMLESDGWQTAVAKQIVAFDPYDQNTFAPWFDPEWMFGLTIGFDIVIGNPPYISYYSRQAVRIADAELEKMKSSSDFITNANKKGRFHSIQFFLDRTYKNLKHSGIVYYIIDLNFFENTFTEIRKYLLNKVSFVEVVANLNEFDNVASGQIILSFKKCKPATDTFVKWKNKFDDGINMISQASWNIAPNYSIGIGETSIIKTIEKESVPFETLCDIKVGVNIGGVKDYFMKSNPKYYKFINGGNNVSAYEIIFPSQKQLADGSAYFDFNKKVEKKIWDDGIGTPSIGESNNRFLLPKLIIRQSDTRLTATYDEAQFHCDYNLFTANKFDSSDIELKYILTLLNSKILTYYVIEKQYLNVKPGKTPQIRVTDIKKLPIKRSKNQLPFVVICDFILLLKKKSFDSSFFERLVDAMVYELYLPEEIKAGGAEVLKHLNNLPELKEGQDDKNLKTIEKVYKELSDPKHPISAVLLKLLTIEEVNIIEGRK